MRRGAKDLRDASGQAAVLFALLGTVLMGSAAIVIDVGRVYILRAQEKSAMVAASLAGATDLPGNPTAALDVAASLAARNGFSGGTAFEVACGGDCIVASVTVTEPSLFAQFLGHPMTQVGTDAVAARGPEVLTSYSTPAPGTATAANGYVFFSGVPSGFANPTDWGSVLGFGDGGGTGSESGGGATSGSGSGAGSSTGTGSDTGAGSGSGAETGTGNGTGSGSEPGTGTGFGGGAGAYVPFTLNPDATGQAALLPFGVTVATATQTTLGSPVVLKVGAGAATDGNFGALRMTGFSGIPTLGAPNASCTSLSQGASVYEENIIYGACQRVSVGEVLATQTGDVVGPTMRGMEIRLSNFRDGPDLAVVPVVQAGTEGEHGLSEVTVKGFAAVLLTAYTPGTGPAMGEVTAEFVGAFLPGSSSQMPSVLTGVFGSSPYLLPPGTSLGSPVAELTVPVAPAASSS